MTDAPDPYYTPGWTSQHQHHTTADPPYLDLSALEKAALADEDLMEAAAETRKADRKLRKR